MPKTLKIHLFNSILFTFVFLGTTLSQPAFGSQEVADKLFKAGKYAEALPLYEQLHQWYPSDENIQYGLAVCLTETGQLGTRPKTLLLQLNSEAFPPERSLFLAKNFHAENNFETALEYYRRYEQEGSRKARKEAGLTELIEACLRKENPLGNVPHHPPSIPVPELPLEDSTLSATAEPMMEENAMDSINAEEKPQEEKLTEQHTENIDKAQKNDSIDPRSVVMPPHLSKTVDTVVNVVVSTGIRYKLISQFKTNEGLNAYIEGINLKTQIQQLLESTKQLREAYNATNDPESKQSIAAKVTENELQLIQLKSQSDALMLQAIESEAAHWQKAAPDEKLRLDAENDSIEQAIRAFHQPAPVNQVTEQATFDEEAADSLLQETRIESQAAVEEPVNHIVYKIQIGAYSKGLPGYIEKLHRKLSVLRKIDQYTDENGVTVYTIGEVLSLQDALSLQEQIRTEGVKDAFVVAYNNGKRITLKEAKTLTKE